MIDRARGQTVIRRSGDGFRLEPVNLATADSAPAGGLETRGYARFLASSSVERSTSG